MNVRRAVRASLHLLDRRDRRLLILSIAIQMATSALDLIGVTLIGMVGALSVATVQNQPPPKLVSTAVSYLGFEHVSNAALLGGLAGSAAIVLLTKSVVSPLLMARVFRFLARRQALVMARLTKELLSRPLTLIQERSSQQTAGALLQGAAAATIGVLGQTVIAGSEIALLTVLAVSLVVADPTIAVLTVCFFAALAAALHKVLGDRAGHFGAEMRESDIESLSAVQEALGTYREIIVADRRSLFVDRIQHLRGRSAVASAGVQVSALMTKYIAEGALVLGAFSVATVLFATQPVPVAAGKFALFLAVATRIMPALLRLQNAVLVIRTASETAAPTYRLAEDLGNPLDVPDPAEVQETIRAALRREHPDFVPCIEAKGVSFRYPGTTASAVTDVTFSVWKGQSLAIVGPSGAGKSTLADLILGVVKPDSGEMTVGGIPPSDAVRRWSGGIAYVPQEVTLVNGSVRANVTLGLPREVVDDDLVWDALGRAHLADHVRLQPQALDTQIGERGLRLSGGQRQRLGIARALFTRPQLVVLDEATSALDPQTERAITDTLDALEESVTTVIVAHRLSTVRNADLVLYLENGRIEARGSFDEVCDLVPAFHRQAALMGLRSA